MRKLFIAGVAVFALCVLLGIAQLWFAPWNYDVFVKIELTLCGVLTLIVVCWFAAREHAEYKATRSGKHMDRL